MINHALNQLGQEEVVEVSFFQHLFAEFFGTMLIVFFGVATQSDYGQVSEVETGLTYGMITSSLVLSFGYVSGAAFNPAVSLAYVLSGNIKIIKGLFYMLVQIAGATLGAALIYAIKSKDDNELGLVLLHMDITTPQALFFEIICVAMITLVYLAVTDSSRKGLKSTSFLLIGIVITVGHLASYRYTKAGMNPARSLATAFVNTHVKDRFYDIWVYVIGPFLGALFATVLYKLVLAPRGSESFDMDYWC